MAETNTSGLSPDRERDLDAVLNELIPASPDGKMPGAGTLGIASAVYGTRPELLPILSQGMESLERLARERGAEGFASLAKDDRLAVLNELSQSDLAFVPTLVFATYVAYYQAPRVLEALGREGRPPHPKGYEMHPFDESLLEPVRRRPKMYRDC